MANLPVYLVDYSCFNCPDERMRCDFQASQAGLAQLQLVSACVADAGERAHHLLSYVCRRRLGNGRCVTASLVHTIAQMRNWQQRGKALMASMREQLAESDNIKQQCDSVMCSLGQSAGWAAATAASMDSSSITLAAMTGRPKLCTRPRTRLSQSGTGLPEFIGPMLPQLGVAVVLQHMCISQQQA